MIRILERLRSLATAEARATEAATLLLEALRRVRAVEAKLAELERERAQTGAALEAALRGSTMGARLRRSVAEYLDGPLTLDGLSAALATYDAELVDAVKYRPKGAA